MTDQNSDLEWWKTGVVYQIYPRSFQDTTGNGVGDLNGITERVGYLADTLGVDAIWISPFYPSPMADFGYDVSDYTDVHPMFGTLDDFDRLLAEAHRRCLRVIIDWVPNHTSDQHPWFIESRSSLTNPKRDWYVWRDSKLDGSLPNNWQSEFGGPAWTRDEGTGQWYLHSFLAEQPDLNWRNPEVAAAMFSTVRFWLDRGVDGFRIDVAHYVMKDPTLADNPTATDPGGMAHFKPMGPFNAWQHVHDRGHPDVHGVYRDLRAILDSYDGDRFSIGEIHISDWDEWAAYYGDGDELHMPFNFSLIWGGWNAPAVRERIESLEAAVLSRGWPNYVLGNHDEQRLATRYGPENARAAAVLLLTLRGQPTIYYGDELALRETDVPPEDQQDPWGMRVPGMSRDGSRTPMPWTPVPGHGFTDPDVKPWLPFGEDAGTRNVETQLGDTGSMLNLVRGLLALRRRRPSLQRGTIVFIDDAPEGVLAYVRRVDGEQTTVLINFQAADRTLPFSATATMLASTDGDSQLADGFLHLAPYSAVVIDPGPGS
ncbi:MAG: alpha-amylase family glycosyl hydrolase [Acidimicrobiia bacterium]